MQIKSGGFSFEMNLEREVAHVSKLPKKLIEITPTILKAMGVQAVSWAIQDFRTRSDGGSAAGVAWKPITESAVRTRLAGRTPWVKQRAELSSLREQEKPILEKLRRTLPSNKTLGNRKIDSQRGNKIRGMLSRQFEEKNPELQKIRKKRQQIRDKRKSTIARELSAARIGVDTGRLVNSLVFGVPELAQIRVPKKPTKTEGLTRGVFDIRSNTIRVGTVIDYAKHFDRLRPIFPDGFIDAARRQSMEKIIELVIAAELKRRGG